MCIAGLSCRIRFIKSGPVGVLNEKGCLVDDMKFPKKVYIRAQLLSKRTKNTRTNYRDKLYTENVQEPKAICNVQGTVHKGMEEGYAMVLPVERIPVWITPRTIWTKARTI